MARDVLHVVPQGEAWAIKREGNERASSTHDTQKDAIDSAHNLADDGDDIVIHRADGTIRNRVTSLGGQNGDGRNDGRTQVRSSSTVKPHDLFSVGERVSWQAVLSGVAVAFTLYLLLTLLMIAIGLSTVDTVRNRTFAIGAAIVGILTLLISLFVGGYVASRMTTRETMGESIIYGVLMWAALFAIFLLTGLNVGTNLALMPNVSQEPAAQAGPANREVPDIGKAEAERQRKEVVQSGERLVSDMKPSSLAWWSFAAMALSLLAAIAGALTGAGPDLVFRRRVVRPTANGRAIVEERPATA